MNQKQTAAANLIKAPFVQPPQGEAFLKSEIARLRERCANQYRKIENLQSACDFYQDKAGTLETVLVNNGLMVRSAL